MKVLIVDTYYPKYLQSSYDNNPDLSAFSYDQQRQFLMDQCFGTADFYSKNLEKLGYEAEEIIVNCKPLQFKWAEENNLSINFGLQKRRIRGFSVPYIGQKWLYPILFSQIKNLKPDVIHFQDPNATDPRFLQEIRPYVRLITAQIASPIAKGADFREFDLMLSSFPHFVDLFRQQGIHSAYFKLGFEPQILPKLNRTQFYDCVFVGGISRSHASRIEFLERLARKHPIDWWGYGVENLSQNSPLRERYHGPAWALNMYDKLYNSRIALNFHINVAENYANNMRLYEATGVGSLLLTDKKDNLPSLFEIDSEIIAYDSLEQCSDLIGNYLNHEDERLILAQAGQKRTMNEHTYFHQMSEFIELIKPLL